MNVLVHQAVGLLEDEGDQVAPARQDGQAVLGRACIVARRQV